MNPDGLFEAALALPEPQRALLVERLLESLSPDTDVIDDETMRKELERRLEEFKSDPSVALPWDSLSLDDQDP